MTGDEQSINHKPKQKASQGVELCAESKPGLTDSLSLHLAWELEEQDCI